MVARLYPEMAYRIGSSLPSFPYSSVFHENLILPLCQPYRSSCVMVLRQKKTAKRKEAHPMSLLCPSAIPSLTLPIGSPSDNRRVSLPRRTYHPSEALRHIRSHRYGNEIAASHPARKYANKRRKLPLTAYILRAECFEAVVFCP